MKHLTSFKILLLFVFILVSNANYAQNVKNTKPPLTLYINESGSFVFDTVINVSGVSKAELYKRAKNWVLTTVRTADKAVVYDDKDSSEIRTDATIASGEYPGLYSNFKISLFFKENKCRIVYESFQYIVGAGAVSFENIPTSAYKKYAKMYYKDFDNLFPPFNKSLIKSLYKNNNSNW